MTSRDARASRYGGPGRSQKSDHQGGGVDALIVAPAPDRRTGCRCWAVPGHHDDPDCGYRSLPTGAVFTEYDVELLGLAPHDRTTCRYCQAVAA